MLYTFRALVMMLAFQIGQAPTDQAPAEKEAAPETAARVLPELAFQVESALIADRLTGAMRLRVNAEEKVVALEGTVPTEAMRERVSRVATRAAGKGASLLANRVRVKAVEEKAKEKTRCIAPANSAPTNPRASGLPPSRSSGATAPRISRTSSWSSRKAAMLAAIGTKATWTRICAPASTS